MTWEEEYCEIYLRCGYCCQDILDPPIRKPPPWCNSCIVDDVTDQTSIPWEEWVANDGV